MMIFSHIHIRHVSTSLTLLQEVDVLIFYAADETPSQSFTKISVKMCT